MQNVVSLHTIYDNVVRATYVHTAEASSKWRIPCSLGLHIGRKRQYS